MQCTEEDKREFDEFMRSRSQYTVQVMHPVPVNTSEQPYKGPQKRKIVVLDEVPAKRKYRRNKRAICNPTGDASANISANVTATVTTNSMNIGNSNNSEAEAKESGIVVICPAPLQVTTYNQEPEPQIQTETGPITQDSEEPDTSAELQITAEAEPEIEPHIHMDEPEIEPHIHIDEPEEPTGQENFKEEDDTITEDPVQDKLAIDLIVSDSEDEEVICHSPVNSLCNSPKITLEEPPLITQNENLEPTCKIITHSPVPVCSFNNDALLLREMHTAQQNRIALNVGGRKFETSVPTLTRESTSILAKMTRTISPIRPYLNEGLQTFFLDRDPSIFTFILDYLRNGMKIVKMWFQTQDCSVRKRIYLEAEHIKLSLLVSEMERCQSEMLF